MLTETADAEAFGLNPGVLEYQFETATSLTLTDLAQLASSGAHTSKVQAQLSNLKSSSQDSKRTHLHLGYISIQTSGLYTFHLDSPKRTQSEIYVSRSSYDNNALYRGPASSEQLSVELDISLGPRGYWAKVNGINQIMEYDKNMGTVNIVVLDFLSGKVVGSKSFTDTSTAGSEIEAFISRIEDGMIVLMTHWSGNSWNHNWWAPACNAMAGLVTGVPNFKCLNANTHRSSILIGRKSSNQRPAPWYTIESTQGNQLQKSIRIPLTEMPIISCYGGMSGEYDYPAGVHPCKEQAATISLTEGLHEFRIVTRIPAGLDFLSPPLGVQYSGPGIATQTLPPDVLSHRMTQLANIPLDNVMNAFTQYNSAVKCSPADAQSCGTFDKTANGIVVSAHQLLYNLGHNLHALGAASFVNPLTWSAYKTEVKDYGRLLKSYSQHQYYLLSSKNNLKARVNEAWNAVKVSLKERDYADSHQKETIDLLQTHAKQCRSLLIAMKYKYSQLESDLQSAKQDVTTKIAKLNAAITKEIAEDKKKVLIQEAMDVAEVAVAVAATVFTGGAASPLLLAVGAKIGEGILKSVPCMMSDKTYAPASARRESDKDDKINKDLDNVNEKSQKFGCDTIHNIKAWHNKFANDPKIKADRAKILQLKTDMASLMQVMQFIQVLPQLAAKIDSCQNKAFTCTSGLLPAMSMMDMTANHIANYLNVFVSNFQTLPNGKTDLVDMRDYVSIVHEYISAVKNWYSTAMKAQTAAMRVKMRAALVGVAKSYLKAEEAEQPAIEASLAVLQQKMVNAWWHALETFTNERRQYSYYTLELAPRINQPFRSTPDPERLQAAQAKLQNAVTQYKSSANYGITQTWFKYELVKTPGTATMFRSLVNHRQISLRVPLPSKTNYYNVRIQEISARVVSPQESKGMTSLKVTQMGVGSMYDSTRKEHKFTFTPVIFYHQYSAQMCPSQSFHAAEGEIAYSPFGLWNIQVVQYGGHDGSSMDLTGVTKVALSFKVSYEQSYNNPFPTPPGNVYGFLGQTPQPPLTAFDPLVPKRCHYTVMAESGERRSSTYLTIQHKTCYKNCHGHGSCHFATGVCICRKPYVGLYCDKLPMTCRHSPTECKATMTSAKNQHGILHDVQPNFESNTVWPSGTSEPGGHLLGDRPIGVHEEHLHTNTGHNQEAIYAVTGCVLLVAVLVGGVTAKKACSKPADRSVQTSNLETPEIQKNQVATAASPADCSADESVVTV